MDCKNSFFILGMSPVARSSAGLKQTGGVEIVFIHANKLSPVHNQYTVYKSKIVKLST
jgi:hypothetical protein